MIDTEPLLLDQLEGQISPHGQLVLLYEKEHLLGRQEVHHCGFEHWLFVGLHPFFIEIVHGAKDLKVRHLDLKSELVAMKQLIVQVCLDSHT